MTSTAQIVVIGGGITGCSIAYHLAVRGMTDVVLLERAELTAGSTWHAAGGFHTLNGNLAIAALQGYTIALYDRLQAECDQPLGLHKTGAIYLAGDEGWAEFFVVEQGRARSAGVDLQTLSMAELRDLAPIINTDKVVGALLDRADGHLDPSGTTHAFAQAARRRGVAIEKHRPVTGLRRVPGGWIVSTEQGDVRCETVVIAAGLWAREVASMAGAHLPILPMEHQYILTDPVPELRNFAAELPTIADFTSGSYLRQEGFGLLYGTYEQSPRHWSLDGTPHDFGQDLLAPDLDRIAPNLEGASERIPCLASAGIRKVVNGPLMVAPDGNPVIGPIADQPGLFVAAGVLAGFSQCGGIGLAIANWIADGEPGMDVWGMDISRFGGYASGGYVSAKTHETYSRRYTLTKPNEHLAAARPLRTTPLYDRFAQEGALFGSQTGWEYPAWFAGAGTRPVEIPSYSRSNAFDHVAEECRAVQHAAGLFETSAYSKFEVAGGRATEWLDELVANALPRKPMRTVLAPLLTRQGRIRGDLTVTRLDEDCYLLIGSPAAEYHYFGLLSATAPRTVTVRNLTEIWGGLSLSGPEAKRILDSISPIADVPLFGAKWVDIGAARALAIRISFTGEHGYEIYAPATRLRLIHDALLEAGRNLGLRHIGVNALNALRLEKLYPSFGSELTQDFNPFEAGLERYVRVDKPGFIGRSAVLEQVGRAPAKQLCGLVLDPGDLDPVGAEPVFRGGAFVGSLTSAAYGHRIGRAVALAYLPAALSRSGADMEVQVLGRRLGASVCLFPPYDPHGARLRCR